MLPISGPHAIGLMLAGLVLAACGASIAPATSAPAVPVMSVTPVPPTVAPPPAAVPPTSSPVLAAGTPTIPPSSITPGAGSVRATEQPLRPAGGATRTPTSSSDDHANHETPPSQEATRPGTALTTYTHPDAGWSIQYPADLFQVEHPGQGVTVFISQDRATVAAVDSYVAPGNAYGNTGEGLRNRARDTLARIYTGSTVNETGIIAAPEGPWETGVTFTTAGGSKGAAFYQQRGRDQGNYRVHGFLYGYKADTEQRYAEMLKVMQDSFGLK